MGGTKWHSTGEPCDRGGIYFTRLSPEDNRRGLGWDKPGLEEDTGASGNAGSWSSFGHSGFTGTLAWTDPEAGWTAVILGNRICPDAENRIYIDEDIRTKALEIVEDAVHSPSRFKEPGPSVGPTIVHCSMRIGMVCYPTFGGSGVVATELGKALAANGHEVHFITYDQPVRLGSFQAQRVLPRGQISQYPLV